MSKYKVIVSDKYLAHYSSPYYDPVKAHEYYMRTRKLKGRRPVISTAGLNEAGHEANEYVKKRIGEERQRVVNKHARETRQKARTYADRAKNQITALSKRLQEMTPADRKYRAGTIRQAVERIRAQNEKKRAELAAKHKSYAISQTRKYEQKYDNELSKIASDAGFKGKRRSRR